MYMTDIMCSCIRYLLIMGVRRQVHLQSARRQPQQQVDVIVIVLVQVWICDTMKWKQMAVMETATVLFYLPCKEAIDKDPRQQLLQHLHLKRMEIQQRKQQNKPKVQTLQAVEQDSTLFRDYLIVEPLQKSF